MKTVMSQGAQGYQKGSEELLKIKQLEQEVMILRTGGHGILKAQREPQLTGEMPRMPPRGCALHLAPTASTASSTAPFAVPWGPPHHQCAT